MVRPSLFERVPELGVGANHEGILEAVESGIAIGWIWNPVAPDCRVAVELLDDGSPVAAVLADGFRQDVFESGRGDGFYGFRLALPPLRGPTVTARIANTGLELPGSRTIPETERAPRAIGRVDHVRGLTISGWCWAPSEPGRHLVVEAEIDGRVVASQTASRLRADLVGSGVGKGDHGFILDLPLAFADGVERLITVRIVGGGVLSGGAVHLMVSEIGPLGMLSRIVSACGGAPPAEVETDIGLLRLFLGQVAATEPSSVGLADYPAWRDALIRAWPAATVEPAPASGRARLLDDGRGGSVVALLDQGTTALPGAFARALTVYHQSGADILYGDAEVQGPGGPTPWFRPDWSYDAFLAQDFTRGLVLIRPGIFGELRPHPSMAALKFAAVEAAARARIIHLPEVLARIEAAPADGKDWLEAVSAHLRRRGFEAEVRSTGLDGARRHVLWPLPGQRTLVSLIIPTRDRLDLLRPCIDSIRTLTRYPDYEIIVVDNQSRDAATLEYLAQGTEAGWFRVLRYDAPFNYSDMNNKAVAAARGTVVGFINNDVELISGDWLREAVALLNRPEVGVVGARLRFANGMLQHAGVVVGVGGLADNAFQHLHADEEEEFHRTNLACNYSAVTAACMFCRKADFLEIGGFNAVDLPVAFNDVDLCLRFGERGALIVWTPAIDLYHYESVSRGADLSPERVARSTKEALYMRRRWNRMLARDPFYNPNLNLTRWPFTGLAFPPRHRWGGPLLPAGEAQQAETAP